MKYGGPGGDGKLHWYLSGRPGYSTPFNAGVWHNGAYEIVRDSLCLPGMRLNVAELFEQGSLLLVLGRGRAPKAGDAASQGWCLLGALNSGLAPRNANRQQDGKDFHVGVLKLPGSGGGGKEDWYFSGVYVESGPITTAVSGPS
jgi:hypothetical protein